MAGQLSDDMIARLKARAGNATRRSDSEQTMAASVGPDDLLASSRDQLAGLPDSEKAAVRDYLKGMNTPFAGAIANAVTGDASQAKGLFGALGRLLGGRSMFASGPGGVIALGGKRGPSAAPPPASEADIAAAERKLGFALPGELRQFYLEVANGGVGPGDGLYSLKELVAKWRELASEPIGPRGQKWPAKLLPIHGEQWDVTCIDRDSGKLVFWDVEEIDYGGWKKSFRDEAESLEAWLDKWLGKPSAEERAKRRAERPAPRQLSDEDWAAWAEEDPLHQEYMRRLGIATMTSEERAAIGLTDANWAEKMWDGFDLTAIRLPRPGHAERKRGAAGAEPGPDAGLDPDAEFTRRLAVYGMSASERRSLGLPDEDWEAKLWEGFDFTKVTREMPPWLKPSRFRKGG